MNKPTQSQIKLPLKVVNDGQGPMGILDATNRAVAWFSAIFNPAKGYAWTAEKEPSLDPACYSLTTFYPERNRTVMAVYHLLQTGGWRPVADLTGEWHSSALDIKHLLLAIPGREIAVRGWYLGGHTQEWREDGSPSAASPLFWMPLPPLPPLLKA